MSLSIDLVKEFGSVKAAKAISASSAVNEFHELIAENLIGEDSRATHFWGSAETNRVQTFQWSHSDNNRWHAMNNAGPAGQQAAGYLEQMVDERRSLANNYMGQYYDLSVKLTLAFQDQPPAPSLDSLMDNVAAGQAPAGGPGQHSSEHVSRVNQFWQENRQDITAMQASYEALKAFPRQLSQWLDTNNVDRPVDVDQVVEQYRYAGFNGVAETSEQLVDTSAARFDGNAIDKIYPIGPRYMYQSFDKYGIANGVDSERIQQTIENAQRDGTSWGLEGIEGQVMMDLDNRAAWGNYQQLFRPMADTFDTAFQSPLEPRFTLQDIIDNLRQGTNPAQLDDGTLHPDAERIALFSQKHDSRLTALAEAQQSLETMPRTVQEWMGVPENKHQAQMAAYERYGIEPWKQGGPMSAGISRFDQSRFDSTDTFHFNAKPMSRSEFKAQLTEDARELAGKLRQTLNQLLGPDLSTPRISLDQIADNMRWGRPLGTMEDGSMHPMAAQIEKQFASRDMQESLGDYLQSDWLRDGGAQLSQMKEVDPIDTTAELLALITQGRAIMNNGIVDTLLMVNDNKTAESQSG